jgi:serine/threonine-protein kinase RsbW
MASSSLPVDHSGPANVRLSLQNTPENVVLVRQTLAGVAETVGLHAAELNDISTAVTEACNNVVLHAYRGGQGPLEVEVYAGRLAVQVAVRDHGCGLQPQAARAKEGAGIGLSVIRALSQSVDFRGTPGGGTEVRMAFATPQARALEPLAETAAEPPIVVEGEPATAMEITIAPAPLAQAILPRLLSVFAARAHFTTDRLADAQLLADALLARVPSSIRGSRLSIAISVEPRDLELRIAPLLAGRAEGLMLDSELDQLGPVIGRLTTQHRVATVGSSDDEMLALRLVDRR